MQRKQQGITLIGFVFFAAAFCAVGLLVIRVFPVYMNYFSIVSSLKDLQTLDKKPLQGSPVMAVSYLKQYLGRKLYVNEIRFIKRKDMKVKRYPKSYEISVPYAVEKSLLGNVSLMFRFNPSYEVYIK